MLIVSRFSNLQKCYLFEMISGKTFLAQAKTRGISRIPTQNQNFMPSTACFPEATRSPTPISFISSPQFSSVLQPPKKSCTPRRRSMAKRCSAKRQMRRGNRARWHSEEGYHRSIENVPAFSVSDFEGIREKGEGSSKGCKSYERNFKGDLEKKYTDLMKSNEFSRDFGWN